MHKVLSLLGVVVAVCGLCLVSTGSASAFGSEQLECRVVTGGQVPAFTATECVPQSPSLTYSVSFEVFGGSGSYTYQWTVPSGFQDYGGCTSTDVGCAFHVPSRQADQEIPVSVVITQGSSQATLSATASLPATCLLGGVPVDC